MIPTQKDIDKATKLIKDKNKGMQIGKFYWLDSMKREAGQLIAMTDTHYCLKADSDFFTPKSDGLIYIPKEFGAMEEFIPPTLKQDWFRGKASSRVQAAYFTRLVELNTAGNVIVNINTFYNTVTEEFIAIIFYYE